MVYTKHALQNVLYKCNVSLRSISGFMCVLKTKTYSETQYEHDIHNYTSTQCIPTQSIQPCRNYNYNHIIFVTSHISPVTELKQGFICIIFFR